MSKMAKARRWLVLVAVLAAGGTFAGAVIASQFGGRGPGPEGLQAAIRTDPVFEVAEIPAEGGLGKRGVFVQPTSAGFVCLWDASNATSRARLGGCNDEDDPFNGQKLFVSLAYEGGPAVAEVKDARLIGLVPLEVAGVDVLMSDGTRRAMPLRTVSVRGAAYRAFGYRFNRADLRAGVAPTTVVALDAAGREIDRQATGFSG
jgi:hypothetical protein